ncbi:unnamed protein product [Bursaphelenchus xylophilus]|uniref:(pine wood nematode) hypothetical protein n=1 Tax=Bursaphelenchus xylophilus TaxID=6326 RepID=A0A811LQA3_BURXY|nr:unnamed protein product [Bursaphelenchus xylophilus]CAG9123419.1 unnamed protein product [Bursaphelenchus xylophilus]
MLYNYLFTYVYYLTYLCLCSLVQGHNDIFSRNEKRFHNFLTASRSEHIHRPKSKRQINHFRDTKFDPDYAPNDLCEPWNSGSQTNDLNWSEPADRLFKLISSSNGYNLFMPPGQHQGKTTNLSVALYIESMSSVKAQTMDFEVDCYLAMGWYDRRLSHNCTHPILITHKHVADELWNPDLYYVNAKYAYLQEVTTPNFMMFVYPDGLVFKSMRTVVTLSCMVDLQFFPMDKQSCPLTIQSYAYIENLLNLSWHVDYPYYPIASNEGLKLNDMEITNITFSKCSVPYAMFRGTGNWSCIRAVIEMKRLMLYHVVQTYIPSAMLVSISWMTFFLPPRASPARISLTITSLLTLTTMCNGARQDLPQVSYISALDVWHFASQALIFLVLLEYSFVSYYMTRGTNHCKHKNSDDTSRHLNIRPSPSFPQEDLRIRLLNNNAHASVNEYPSKRHESLANPIGGVARLRRTHSMDRNSLGTRKSFSVATGVEQCVNHSAMFCRLAAIQQQQKRLMIEFQQQRQSVFDIEHDTAELFATHCNVSMDSIMEIGRPCTRCQLENEGIARKIDAYSRIAFPSVFFSFTLIYWFYYGYYTRAG